jgi:hypothetical protein
MDVTSIDAAGANAASDDYGKVYVRRRLLGTAPVQADGSAHITMPGGVPFVIHLPDTSASKTGAWPRWQRESMVFAPGETLHQGFRRDLFDGLCAGCHGTVSGRPLDFAVRPDILTQASVTVARDLPATNLDVPPTMRGDAVGPPAAP